MREPYWWYVLYVRTNTEHRVVSVIEQFYKQNGFHEYELEPFCPETEFYCRNIKWRIPGKKYLKRPLFPNYVFIETNMPALKFLEFFSPYVYNSTDILRILKYGDGKSLHKTDDNLPPRIALSLEERQRLEYLLKGRRCLEHSEGYLEGDKVIIVGGPLIGLEGCIKKINRHNRTADIELEVFNRISNVKVAFEILTKK